jgi:hypothetical protein
MNTVQSGPHAAAHNNRQHVQRDNALTRELRVLLRLCSVVTFSRIAFSPQRITFVRK